MTNFILIAYDSLFIILFSLVLYSAKHDKLHVHASRVAL